MKFIDVFNGDADGICALHQLRLSEPVESALLTGVKRDIALLERVDAAQGDLVTVLDIALEKNRSPLLKLLAGGTRVRYFDHHAPGDIPVHPLLDACIDTDARICTSLLINRYLHGKHLIWAVVGAFGDNLDESARRAAEPLSLSKAELAELQSLGKYLNYNGYGESVEDLYFHPAELYQRVHRHENPFGFIRDDPAYPTLQEGYADDMARAASLKPLDARPGGAVFLLPDAPWSRRISGEFGNRLASEFPQRAHAVLTRKTDGAFQVSARAPLASRAGADELCRQFPTGGGRKAAAGINHLPETELEHFLQAFYRQFPGARGVAS